jgi:dihydroorotate dehydrogenase
MLQAPFYNPKISYDKNYADGPFGAFANGKIYKQSGIPKVDFLGQKVFLPFGIPAGPLINSKFVKGAFEKGFDICVYKTVRAQIFPCHPFPNVLAVHFGGKNLTLERLKNSIVADENYEDPISITNSFGVPSKKSEIWQDDAKEAITYAGPGQVMILSFMGTVKEGQTQQEFIEDFAQAAKLAHETGAKILEANLSCPNIGNEGLVCYNLEVTEKITKRIRSVIGNTPLVLKIGYYKEDSDLEKLAAIANEYANDIAGINTLQAKVVDSSGQQALPGPKRSMSGICGHGIKWAGIDTVRRLAKIKDKNNYKFRITGVGGVTKTDDYFDYRKAGADAVMSATGAMWGPGLAQEIKKATD